MPGPIVIRVWMIEIDNYLGWGLFDMNIGDCQTLKCMQAQHFQDID